MLYLVGQVPRGELGREALQEVDFRAMFAPLAKWAEEVIDPRRIPELVRRAFVLATSGRPGPVVLSLPEDVLVEQAVVADALPYAPSAGAPATAELARVRERLARAERPLAARRRRRLERRGGGRGAGLRRGLRPGGRQLVSLPGLHRQPLGVLRRAPDDADRSGARPARARGRPAARRRRPPRRCHDRRLHA